MVAALTLVAGLVLGPNPVWRSVGSNPNALDTGTNVGNPGTLSISASTATFSRPVSDRIGLGDVIEYDSNGDGTPDQLAFITLRNSATSFDLADKGTNLPAAVGSTTAWSVFRAYLSLAAALNTASRPGLEVGGTENPAIDSALRNFDAFDGGKDLPGNGHRWMVACYDDGTPDDSLVWVGPPWKTDALHRIEIFTPVNANQVGVSQRHDGTWGTGYRRTHALQVVDRDVWIDGLSLRQARPLGPPLDSNYDNRVLLVHTGHKGSSIRISNCYGEQADTSAGAWARTFDFFDDDVPYGTLQTVIRVWNTIGVTQSPNGASAAFINNTSDDLFFDNCTAVAPNGGTGFYGENEIGGAKAAVIVNGLGQSAGGRAVALSGVGVPFVISSTAVNDTSIDSTTSTTPDAGNVLGQTFTFADADAGDYRMAVNDTGARGLGVDLSANAALAFSTDINGYPRTLPWDVGASQHFVPVPPSVRTSGTTVLTVDSARLEAVANGNASPTLAWFRYGLTVPAACDDAFGTRAPASGTLAVGSSGNVLVGQLVAGLTPGATYVYCAIATNRAGTTFGSVLTFVAELPPDAGQGGDGGTSDGGTDASARHLDVRCGCGHLAGPGSIGLLLLVLSAARARRSPRARPSA